MNDILLKITNGDRTLAQACNHLVYPVAYAPGDSITMTVPEPGYYVIRLDDAMNEEFVYMKGYGHPRYTFPHNCQSRFELQRFLCNPQSVHSRYLLPPYQLFQCFQ